MRSSVFAFNYKLYKNYFSSGKNLTFPFFRGILYCNAVKIRPCGQNGDTNGKQR